VNKKHKDIREPLVEALSQSPMLRYLGKNDRYGRELRDMLESGELHEFAEGDTIIREGEESDAVYVLATGAVAISLNGSEICIMNQPGEVFGEFGVMTGELRSATVTARNDVTCFAISSRFTSRKALEENAVFHGLMQQALTKIVLGRLRHANEELVSLRKSLSTTENQVAFLRMDNEMLQRQLDEARQGLRGTRGSGGPDKA
jgi:CRP-like cAMP-binding protein